jgi:hypothetical protein
MDRTTGNLRLWAASGYRYGSDPNAPLEREQAVDWFLVAMSGLCLAITAATIAFIWSLT